MDKLKIVIDKKEIKVEYTERFCKGIFLVQDNKAVKRNCAALKIEMTETTNDLQLSQKITKLEKVGILTIKVSNELMQFIIMNYAAREDFEKLLREIPKESHAELTQTYNLTKMNSISDFDLLGNALDSSN